MNYQSNYQTNYQTRPPEQPSLGDLFSRLSDQVSTLFRQEVQLAQAEISRKATRAGRNVAIIVIGGVVGLGAFLSIVAALILLLSIWLAPWLAALIVGVLLAIGAALLVNYGLNKLKEIDPAPRRTIETMRENKEWLTQQI
jgi:MFS family permease